MSLVATSAFVRLSQCRHDSEKRHRHGAPQTSPIQLFGHLVLRMAGHIHLLSFSRSVTFSGTSFIMLVVVVIVTDGCCDDDSEVTDSGGDCYDIAFLVLRDVLPGFIS